MADQQGGNVVRGGLLNGQRFRWMMSLPIWGGPWSYLIVETDPEQEMDCIRAFQATATPERRLAALGPLLPQDQPFPDTLEGTIATLGIAFPISGGDVAERNRLENKVLAARVKYRGTDTEFETERQKRVKIFEWDCILKAVPTEAKAVLAAWNRLERDAIYNEIGGLGYLSRAARWDVGNNITAITHQEDRWRNGVSMGLLERIFFWFWNVLMLLGVIIPDMINFALSAFLAVIRSLPNRPQGMAMASAIMDFPYADERLARLTLFQRFLGALVTILFGIKAVFDPEFHASAFRGIKELWWKALLAVFWQTIMQNWKNMLDLFCRILIRQKRLSASKITKIRELLERLELSNARNFVWFETYRLGNRFRAQVSYHKQDQGDVATALRWAIGFKHHSIPSEDLFSKFSTWVATTVIGILICASTFPVDPYAGLIALAYYANIIAKMGLDVWDSSQNYDDVLRFFTATIGPTFPSTVVLIINLFWWIFNRSGLYKSVDYRFGITLAALFVASLYPKFWGEMFKRFGLWLRSKFVRERSSSAMELQERGD